MQKGAAAEIEPGRYAVSFTLPMVEGRVLRATPILPPTCRAVTDRVEGAGLAKRIAELVDAAMPDSEL